MRCPSEIASEVEGVARGEGRGWRERVGVGVGEGGGGGEEMLLVSRQRCRFAHFTPSRHPLFHSLLSIELGHFLS